MMQSAMILFCGVLLPLYRVVYRVNSIVVYCCVLMCTVVCCCVHMCPVVSCCVLLCTVVCCRVLMCPAVSCYVLCPVVYSDVYCIFIPNTVLCHVTNLEIA